MEFAVATRGLTRTFGSKRAVDGIDLQVPAGSFYGFLGPNGAGKSTTIKCLTGLLRPSSGEIRILNLDPNVDPVEIKRRVGVVPEDLALFDRLTAAETLSFIGQVHGIPAETFRSRSADLLSLMDLTGSATTLVADFSHGMRKKLSLAAALLPAPRLLFLDDKELLHSFIARGGTVFLTSHILEIVERLSTHIGVIANGRMVAQGRIEDVRSGAQGTGTLEELFIDLVGGERAAVDLNWL